MKTLSSKKLAETVKNLRESKGYTKEELGDLTGINRIMIGRIERENFTPSIAQFEALANVLNFDFTEMFIEKESTNSFVVPICNLPHATPSPSIIAFATS